MRGRGKMAPVPRVSVLIATYNWSSVLPYSIGSALRQTFTDFEVLVVGDGCTDDSAQVVAALGDPRVRWINLPANSGHQSTPNNEGLRQARGEFIAYLGHDDLWLPHHLQACVAAFDAERADVAYGLVITVTADGRLVPIIPRPKLGLFTAPSGMAHRRSVTEKIGGWPQYRSVRVPPETELWRRAQAAGYRFASVPRLGTIKFPASWRKDVYRTHPSHEQASWFARMESEPDLEAQLLAKLIVDDPRPGGGAYSEIARYFIDQTMKRIRWRLSHGRTIQTIRHHKGL